jgi:hypothetical protein
MRKSAKIGRVLMSITRGARLILMEIRITRHTYPHAHKTICAGGTTPHHPRPWRTSNRPVGSLQAARICASLLHDYTHARQSPAA